MANTTFDLELGLTCGVETRTIPHIVKPLAVAINDGGRLVVSLLVNRYVADGRTTWFEVVTGQNVEPTQLEHTGSVYHEGAMFHVFHVQSSSEWVHGS